MNEWTLLATDQNDWMAYVFGINFLLFVFCKQQFSQQFFTFFRVIDTPLYFSSYGERSVLQQGFVICSVLFSIINSSLFLGFLLAHYTEQVFDLSTFGLLFGGLSLVVILRQIILLGLGFFIDLNSFINQYQFRQATYLFRLSFLGYVGLVFYHFTFAHSPLFFDLMLYMVLGLYLLYHFMVYRQLFNVLNKGGMYFILYLCTLKLTPWVLLFKGLNNLL